MIDIMGLMGLFPKEYEDEILKNSIGGIQNAANNFQWGLVRGLDAIENVSFNIINSLYIGSYPKRYKEKKIPSFKFRHIDKNDGINDGINVGFCNLTIYKVFSKFYGLKQEIDNWANKGNQNEKVIIAYAMTSPFVELLKYVKTKYPNIICLLVVPDLPEFMNVAKSSNFVYKMLKRVQINHFKKALKKIDGYILLTDAMKEWFDTDIRYTVVEGLPANEIKYLENKYNGNKKKSILYAGMIEEKYGVLELVKAFLKIDNKEWQLDLYGAGSGLEEIQRFVNNNHNIIIHGVVPNNVVREEQKKAEILVNPRNDKFEFTKYSFPSKIIEYMSSGTPMVGYKLPGIPDEYCGFFYEIPSSEDGMYKTLKHTMELTSEERSEMGDKALKFIIKEKNAKTQCLKIIDLINSIR